nr:MAG TPA: hypothetical protein [Caudoviricetes sp.]
MSSNNTGCQQQSVCVCRIINKEKIYRAKTI